MRNSSGGRLSRRALIGFGLIVPTVVVEIGARAAPGSGSGTPGASPAASPAASPVATPTAGIIVRMTAQLRFDPPEVTVARGQAITWVNVSPLPHTATGDPAQNPVAKTRPEEIVLPPGAKAWGSKLLNPGERYTHVFTVPGTYRYICIPHVLSGMHGVVTVRP